MSGPDSSLHVLVYFVVLLVFVWVFVKVLLVSVTCDKVVGLSIVCYQAPMPPLVGIN